MTPTSNPDTLFELMDRLTENSVAITQVTASLNELNSGLFTTNKNLEKFTDEIKKTLADHEIRIVDVEHNCRKEGNWDRCWNRLDALEQAEMQRVGAKQYELVRMAQIESRLDKGSERIEGLHSQLKSHLDGTEIQEKIEDKQDDRTQEYVIFILGLFGTLVVGYVLAKMT